MKNALKKLLSKPKHESLYQPRQNINSADQCNFYHTTDIPGVGVIKGQWDLREGIDEYLGHSPVAILESCARLVNGDVRNWRTLTH